MKSSSARIYPSSEKTEALKAKVATTDKAATEAAVDMAEIAEEDTTTREASEEAEVATASLPVDTEEEISLAPEVAGEETTKTLVPFSWVV